jgi:hypothetical protein
MMAVVPQEEMERIMAAKKASASKTSRKAKARSASKKRKAGAGATAKKAVLKKAAVKKTAAKKAVVKKASVKKVAAKKTAKKASAKKRLVRKTAAKTPAKKIAARKTAVRKSVAKKAVAKKTAVKKTSVKKTLAVKPEAKITALVRASPARKARAVTAKTRPRPSIGKPSQARPVTVMPIAKEPTAKPAKAARGATRKATSSLRPARSAARGGAPMPAVTPISAAAKEIKTHLAADEPLSEPKLREDIRTSVLYLEAWLRSSGADTSPVMEELAAAAEASRAQVWRWLDKGARFSDDRLLSPELFEAFLNQEMELLRDVIGFETYDAGLFVTASQLFLDLALAPDFEDFPGLPAARLLE